MVGTNPMSGRFRTRPTRPLGSVLINGWRLKRYEITLDGRCVADSVHSAVEATLGEALPEVPVKELGLGFLIVHHGAESVWLLADLWSGDILSQYTFSAPLADPTDFRPVPAGGPTACVWELSVHNHERETYIKNILDPDPGPDVDAYLSDTLTVPGSNWDLVSEFNRAWAEADVERLMSLMTDTPIYRASTGPGPGLEYVGFDQVKNGFASVIDAETVAGGQSPPPQGEIHIFGERGISFWSYPVATAPGDAVLVEGIDVWTFENGRIATKDAYRKSFPDPQPGKAGDRLENPMSSKRK